MPTRYNPDKHHRRSIRLQTYDYTAAGAYFITICTHQRECLFGAIGDSEMRLSLFGEVVRSHWLRLPKHHSHVQLDEFVVMPNHFHGILILTDDFPKADRDDRSAGLLGAIDANVKSDLADRSSDSDVSMTDANVRAGLANLLDITEDLVTKPAPTKMLTYPKRHGIPEIVRGFKTFSARRINQIRKIAGIPV